MAYSKDPEKRRRQLEALARSNPNIDVEELLARHGARDAESPPKPSRDAHEPRHDAGDGSPDHEGASHEHPTHGDGEKPEGLLAGFVAEDADVDVDGREDGRLLVVFWGEGADPERPTLGVPVTDAAARALSDALTAVLGPDEDDLEFDADLELEPRADDRPEELDVETLRVRDLERPASSDGSVTFRAGEVELEMTSRDGRTVTARLNRKLSRLLSAWLKPGWFDSPKVEHVFTAGDEPREGAAAPAPSDRDAP